MACSSSNNSIIQSSSCSSSNNRWRNYYYDVFVSFRGTDTRFNFTDHLFAAFRRKGVVAFKDDTKLKKGESLAPELLRAIEASQIYIIVFSKNYASSTWCLQELEYILHCVQASERRVLPVFDDVDPSDVRYQKGSYDEAFAKHEDRFKQNLEMVQRWREALTRVANLSGWDMHLKPQSSEIEKIVEEIMNILGHKFSSLPKDLVGMHSPIEELEKFLLLDSVDDVRVVGICGMGGIGKTTLATVLYGRISHQFDACCFIDDVSKIYRLHDGPDGAQKQILHQTLGEEHLQICNLYDATNLIRSRLLRLKTLIILDNVDQVEQLEKLAVHREWLGAGSRIIIVSRDEHVLKVYGVDVVYKVPLLDETDCLHLFCRKAFKRNNIMSNYESLANEILNYVDGLPLAVKVLGSFLFDRDISEWRSALARLRESPNKDIMDVLRLSFDGLEEMEKEIFLDIACFFNKQQEKYVKNVLNCRGFQSDIGLRVLIDKSLVSVSYGLFVEDNRIHMHDLLEQLGRKIVQENSTKEPRKWSRLWLRKYFYNVMLENMEKNVEAIVLRNKDPTEPEISMAESLSKMSHLRLLILEQVNISGCLNCLSDELRYVKWNEYPFMYLPSSFQPNQLVELILKHSSIKRLWKGKKYLSQLRTLDLSDSKNLKKMPDFGEIPNLEQLNLEGCVKLKHMDRSIGVLRKLVYLNLKGCKNLESIPDNIFGLSSLKDLNLSGCSKVFNNPRRLKRLDTSKRELHSQSTSSILKRIKSLPFQYLYPTPRAHTELLPFLLSFSCLHELDISFCGLRQVPDAIGCLPCLHRLKLGGNNFVTLPSLRELSKLVHLNLEHCKLLKSLPDLPSPPTAIEQDHHTTQTEIIAGGMLIFNCPELADREQCSSMTFLWMIQFIQSCQQSSSASYHHIDVVIPRSKIPSWFKYQSAGDSISMDPSPIMHDNNTIGVACCAIFSVAPDDDPTATTNRSSAEICLGFSSHRGRGRYTRIPVIIERDLITAKSNHMCLMYLSQKSLFEFLSFTDNLDDIKMCANIRNAGGLDVEVKNCGYHWVCEEDLQQFNLTTMHRRDSLAQKCKFLAIQDEAQSQHNHSSD